MTQLAVGPDGDLALDSTGTLYQTDDLGQAVACSLRMLRGEWFLDLERGVPWFQQILRKGVNLAHVRAAFRSAILATPGITSLDALDLQHDRQARTLSVSFRANGASATVALTIG